jgi:hypothetical protein
MNTLPIILASIAVIVSFAAIFCGMKARWHFKKAEKLRKELMEYKRIMGVK